MLLRYFGKIGLYTPIHVSALAIALAVAAYALQSLPTLEWVFVYSLFAIFALGAWTIFRDRWLHKNQAYRFLAISIFLPILIAELTLYKIILLAMAGESIWHWAEFYRRQRNPFWLMATAFVNALLYALFPEEALFFGLLTVLIFFTVGQLNGRAVLQALLAATISYGTAAFFVHEFTGALPPLFTAAPPAIPLSAWSIPVAALLLVAYQTTLSFRRANNLNKTRSLVALIWVVLSFVWSAFFGAEGPYIIGLLGLSFLMHNALHYTQRRRGLQELLLWVFLGINVAIAFNFVVL